MINADAAIPQAVEAITQCGFVSLFSSEFGRYGDGGAERSPEPFIGEVHRAAKKVDFRFSTERYLSADGRE